MSLILKYFQFSFFPQNKTACSYPSTNQEKWLFHAEVPFTSGRILGE